MKAHVKQVKQKKGKHFEKKKRFTIHEENVIVQKQVKKVLKRKKKKRTEVLLELEKMIISGSDQKSVNSSSSKLGEI